jgi:hypothetical protein
VPIVILTYSLIRGSVKCLTNMPFSLNFS